MTSLTNPQADPRRETEPDTGPTTISHRVDEIGHQHTRPGYEDPTSAESG